MVNVYPNPTSEYVNVVTNRTSNVTLVDNFGRVLYTNSVSGSQQIDLSNLNNGIYFVKVDNQSKKLILNK